MLGEERVARAVLGTRERRAGALEGEAVDPPLVVVERRFDARQLLLGEDVGGKPRLDLGKPRVVGVPKRLEGAGEFVERRRDVVGGGFGGE